MESDRRGPTGVPMTKRLDWTNLIFISSAHLLAAFAVVYMAAIHFSWWTIGLGFLWFTFCGLAITGGGVHRHVVRLPGFRTEGTAKDGDHGHLVLVHKTGFGGPHAHALTVGGVTMQSLLVEDFLRLLAEEDEGSGGP